MLKLYDYPDCPFCQKVRVMLAEKDLEYEKIFVDLLKQEQKSPDFLRLNPYGKVPVLVDEDEVIYDSTIINEYLEDEYPLPRMMPEDSQGRARVRLLEDYCDNSFIPRPPCCWRSCARRTRSGTSSVSSRRGRSCAGVSTSSAMPSAGTSTWWGRSSRWRTCPSPPASWCSGDSAWSSSPRSPPCRCGSTASEPERACEASGFKAPTRDCVSGRGRTASV